MDITIERTEPVTIVIMGKRIDTDSAKEYEKTLGNLIEEGTKSLLLDFSRTDYIGSAGLRVLLIMAKKMKKNGGKFGLCQIRPQPFEVFKAGGFHTIFPIFQTREEGMLDILSSGS